VQQRCDQRRGRPGESLVTLDGGQLDEERIDSLERVDGVVRTVAIRVPGTNTYLADGVWTHNDADLKGSSAGPGISNSGPGISNTGSGTGPSISGSASSSSSSSSGSKSSGSSFSSSSSIGVSNTDESSVG